MLFDHSPEVLESVVFGALSSDHIMIAYGDDVTIDVVLGCVFVTLIS